MQRGNRGTGHRHERWNQEHDGGVRRNRTGAAACFKTNTSVGLDLWAPYEIAMCDLSDLDKLGLLHMEWGEAMIVPAQWLTNLCSMIPKTIGHRCVASMATGWRINTTLGATEERHGI